MKKILLIAALLAGCSTVPEAPVAPVTVAPAPPTLPGMPPLPVLAKAKAKTKAVAGPRLMSATSAALTKVAPTWAFTNISGTYQIDASTNLVTWWPVAVVYDVVGVSLTSDTVDTQPILFYRLQPVAN